MHKTLAFLAGRSRKPPRLPPGEVTTIAEAELLSLPSEVVLNVHDSRWTRILSYNSMEFVFVVVFLNL